MNKYTNKGQCRNNNRQDVLIFKQQCFYKKKCVEMHLVSVTVIIPILTLVCVLFHPTIPGPTYFCNF